MAFSDFTSPDSVRAALGVSAREAKDSLITDPIYLTELLERLDEFGADFRTHYATARDAEPRSEAQNRLVLLTQTFCAYTVALMLVPILPVALPQRQSDSKTEVERVQNPFEKLQPLLENTRNVTRARIRVAYAVLTGDNPPVAVFRTRLAAVGAAPDTVTG